MIVLSACHMALMLDVRASCASMEMNAAANSSNFVMNWNIGCIETIRRALNL
jgi:hypothetical protein